MVRSDGYRAEDLLSVGEAARLLGCSSDTLLRWEAEGRISSSRTLGGHRRFKVADVEALRSAPNGGSAA